MSIEKLTLDLTHNELQLEFVDNFKQQLSFEFLRVYSPLEKTPTKSKPKPVVAHQKMVRLQTIEPLAKHGFRLLFDDGHSAVYSTLLLNEYAHNKNRLWQEYLTEIKTSGQSREAMIAFKQV